MEPRMNPKFVMVDFEQAAIKAFKEVFPGSQVTGCLFHLSQSINRKINEKGLSSQFRSDEEFCFQVCYLCNGKQLNYAQARFKDCFSRV